MEAEDTIRVFGQAWSMIGDEPSLASLFKDTNETAIEQEPVTRVVRMMLNKRVLQIHSTTLQANSLQMLKV